MKCPICDKELDISDPMKHFDQNSTCDSQRLFNIGFLNQEELNQINDSKQKVVSYINK